MEQLLEFLKVLGASVEVKVNLYRGCLHEDVRFNFPNMCLTDRKKWFKAVKCRMISNAANEMSAKEVGILAAGLTMINPKQFFDSMKPVMTGKEIEKLFLEQIENNNWNNCAFGKSN